MRADHDDLSLRSTGSARLKRRADFLRVGKGRRWHGTAMTLQTEARATEIGRLDEAPARFGFTLTKRVGNSVIRNRARRRLREAVRLAPDLSARVGHDYVIVGRFEAIRLPFEALSRELARGVLAVHERGKRRDDARPTSERNDVAASETPKGRFQKSIKAKSSGRSAPKRTRPAT